MGFVGFIIILISKKRGNMKYIHLVVGLLLANIVNAQENTELAFQKHEGSLVKIEKEPNSRLESFLKSAKYIIKDRDIEILSCKELVSVHVTSIVNGNVSYGGICSVKDDGNVTTAFVCDDNMVGHFSLFTIDEDKFDTDRLIESVYDNCYGG